MAKRPYLSPHEGSIQEHAMGVLSRSVEDRDQRDSIGEGASAERARAWRSRRVADLSSGIAHEVRNPLNAMAIHLEVLADKLRDSDGKLPESIHPNLDAIRNQIHRLDRMIRRFADFAQGRTPDRALSAILETAVALCSFPMRRLGLDAEVSPMPDVRVPGAASLSLALVETLLLGVDAAEVGSKIRISAEQENGHIRIRFQTDTPNGRVDPERLAMVGELLEEQGGRLDTEDRPGIFAVLSIPVESGSA